jgi:hypothetical protein
MRTTIELPDELFRQAKIRAATEGRKLKDLFCAYIEEGLNGANAAEAPSLPRRRSPAPVARRTVPFEGVIPALTNTEIAEILDEEDAERALRFARP